MAGWVPAVAALGEPGPAEIARAGDGIRLVAPGDVEQLAGTIDRLLSDGSLRAELRAKARATVEAAFTWERCGEQTVAAYEEALAG
jgi:glycosyltransferase involved in cell wall biosynthesis